MASYFRQSRNVELSTLKYLEDSFATDWSDITTVKTSKQVYASQTSLPIVCIRLADKVNIRLEVGADTLDPRYLIAIDIYARSDAQRLDIADYIVNKLKDGWVHYDHSHVSGDKSTLELSANGRNYVTDWITDGKIDTGETVDEKDKYHHHISIQIRKST